ncbi:MAG: hypothetical protein ACLFTZ_03050 [Acholeplasmataceae bacterium]
MNDLLSEVKGSNQRAIKRKGGTLLSVELAVIVSGIVLLLTDADRFATLSAFVLFFTFIMLIVTLFLLAAKGTKNRETKIRNTIGGAYRSYIASYNDEAGTAYAFHPDRDQHEPWLLVPSYAEKTLRHTLRYDSIDFRLEKNDYLYFFPCRSSSSVLGFASIRFIPLPRSFFYY